MKKDREVLKFDNKVWGDLVFEDYLFIDNEEVPIREVEREYIDSGRHTERWYLIFERLSDGKFFKVCYETSVKDTMGWKECNYGDGKAVEVFPKTITKTVYI